MRNVERYAQDGMLDVKVISCLFLIVTNNINTAKEQERAELHRAIWQIANDLRGSVDGWDFKQYVLGILFYRFISENLTSYINEDAYEFLMTMYAANDYNIAMSSYVVGEDTREIVDITELNAKIAKIVARQSELRTAIDEIVADIEGNK